MTYTVSSGTLNSTIPYHTYEQIRRLAKTRTENIPDVQKIYSENQIKQDTRLLPITSPNVDRLSKFFHHARTQQYLQRGDDWRSRHTSNAVTGMLGLQGWRRSRDETRPPAKAFISRVSTRKHTERDIAIALLAVDWIMLVSCRNCCKYHRRRRRHLFVHKNVTHRLAQWTVSEPDMQGSVRAL